MTDFVQSQGPAFLAHLLRRLADALARQDAVASQKIVNDALIGS